MFGSAGNDARLVRPPALGTALAAVPFLAIIAGVRYDCGAMIRTCGWFSARRREWAHLPGNDLKFHQL